MKMVKYVILKTGKREGSLTAPLFILWIPSLNSYDYEAL